MLGTTTPDRPPRPREQQREGRTLPQAPLLSSPPPRLAPLTTPASASSSSSLAPSASAKPHSSAEPTASVASSSPPPALPLAQTAPLRSRALLSDHATRAAAASKKSSASPNRIGPSAPTAVASLAVQRRCNAPSSQGLWRLAASNPQPPHLAPLSSHPVWCNEQSWRRSKPLTRRVTTTLRATSLSHGSRRPSHSTASGGERAAVVAESSRQVPRGVRKKTRVVKSCGREDTRDNSMQLPEPATLPSASHSQEQQLAERMPEKPQVSPLADDVCDDAEHKRDMALSAPASTTSVESIDGEVVAAVPLRHEDAHQPDYATTHRLPELFADMLRDLTLAQGTGACATAQDGDVSAVEQWIQDWFRCRYEASQPPVHSPPSPRTLTVQPKRINSAQRQGKSAEGPATLSLRGMRAAPSPLGRRRVSSASLASDQQRFVPLTVRPTHDGLSSLYSSTPTASAARGCGDDLSLCTSRPSSTPSQGEAAAAAAPQLLLQQLLHGTDTPIPTPPPPPPPPPQPSTTTVPAPSVVVQPSMPSPSTVLSALSPQLLSSPPAHPCASGTAQPRSVHHGTPSAPLLAGPASPSARSGRHVGSARPLPVSLPPPPPSSSLPPGGRSLLSASKRSLTTVGGAAVVGSPSKGMATLGCAVGGRTSLSVPEAAHTHK